MEILTEFDELQEAMKRINLDEAVMPYFNGRLVPDSGSYNKVQKILDCPEMISAHKYLYNLDLDQLSEEETEKIDKLYKLGCERGFIADDLTDWDKELADVVDGNQAAAPAVEQPQVEKPIGGTLFKAKVPCWTVIYSASSKDGQIKTGEAYSNAISASAAKADVKAKLSAVGYANITILAIESCEADVEAGCFGDCQAVAEDDILKGKPHNGHVEEADEEEDSGDDGDDGSNDTEADDGSDDVDDSDDSSDDDSSDDSSDESDDGSEDSDDAEGDNGSDDADDSSDDADDSDDGSDDESDDGDSEDSDEGTDDSDDESDDADGDDDSDGEDDDDADDSDGDEKEELDPSKKAELKDKYKKAFKNVLVKCKFDTSFNDLTLEQKVKFFTELAKAWTKNEPNEFMTDKEIEQLNNVVVKPENA